MCDPSDELVDLMDDAQAVLDVTSECVSECAAQVRIRVNTKASFSIAVGKDYMNSRG